MKKSSLLIFIFAVIIIQGCAGIKSTARVATETAYLESIARTGETNQVLKSAELNDFELMQLTHAFNTLANFRGKWKSFLNAPLDSLNIVDPDELKMDFVNIKAQYMIVYNVAMNNWDQFDTPAKQHLILVHRHASRLDKSIETMIEHKELMSAVKTALEYVATAGTIAVALK